MFFLLEVNENSKKDNKRRSLLAGVLGHIDINSAEGKKLLKEKSRNVGAIRLVSNNSNCKKSGKWMFIKSLHR